MKKIINAQYLGSISLHNIKAHSADCTKKRCSHKIILGKHFCFAEWVNFVREEAEERACRPVADAGKCMVCHETVPGKRGWKAERSRHYHLFNECKEYPYSKINKQ